MEMIITIDIQSMIIIIKMKEAMIDLAIS